MTTLVHIPTGLQTPELEILLSRAQQAIDGGGEVIVVGCPGGRGYACSLNIYGLPPICHVCKRQRSRGLDKLRGPFTYVESPIANPDQNAAPLLNVEIKDRWAIKSLTYRSVDVGQAVYSSYVGLSRDLDLEGVLSRVSLRKLHHTALLLSAYWFELLKEKKVQRVILYNGRQNHNRPLLRVARLLGIEAEVMEFSGPDARCVYQFHNCPPLDLNNLAMLIDKNWETVEGDREEIARQYFEFKRQGAAVNERSFVLGQTKGLLPDGWDPQKRNIVIFNSSEDEFAAAGGEYDETLYPNQTEAVSRICDALDQEPDLRIYLRMHPNLSPVKWGFARQLRKMGSLHNNVVVVPPESPISTYAMLTECNVVVSFGSTIGIEAVYWGKPSILVRRCIYESTGSVYVPKTHDELIALLKDRSLPPLPSHGAKKVAVFWYKGGRAIDYLGGSRAAGFTFMGHHFKKGRVESLIYLFFKGIEKWLLGNFVNYYLGMKWKGLTRALGLFR